MTKTNWLLCITAIGILLSACSHTAPAQYVDTGDGGRGWRITCGGMFSSTGDCYDKASYQCMNRGYTIVRETDISPPQSPFFWNEAGAHEIVARCN